MDDQLLYFAAVRGPHSPCEDHSTGLLTRCGADGTRTRDPRTASAVRYQLRYSPEKITTTPPRCVGNRTRDRG